MNRTINRIICLLVPTAAVGVMVLINHSGGGEPDEPVQLAANQVIVPPPAGDELTVPIPDPHSGFKFVGAAGCAAANCHGGSEPSQVVGSEHSIWLQKDPHATKAYAVLFNEDSKRIFKYLQESPRYKDELKGKQAHTAKMCLDCHSLAPDEAMLADGHKFSLGDGVSCEACHGAAEKWLDAHKRQDWQFYSTEQKAALGFINTDDLLYRSRMCAKCHIGDATREVNHDIMAGGHPRLTFEMTAYSANLPAHWNRNADRRQDGVVVAGKNGTARDVRSAFEAKLWALGQVAVAEKSLELLEARARRSEQNGIWPEFTEYACYACHHDLQSSAWRQKRGFPGTRPGHYPWGTWQYPLVSAVIEQFGPQADHPFKAIGNERSAIDKLRLEMGRPLPNAEKVQSMSAAIRTELAGVGETISRRQFTEADVRLMLSNVVENGGQWSQNNWDTAAQTYLALVAAYQALVDVSGRAPAPSTEDREIYDHFKTIRAQLKFPKGYDSPNDFEKNQPNKLKALLEELDAINKKLQ